MCIDTYKSSAKFDRVHYIFRRNFLTVSLLLLVILRRNDLEWKLHAGFVDKMTSSRATIDMWTFKTKAAWLSWLYYRRQKIKTKIKKENGSGLCFPLANGSILFYFMQLLSTKACNLSWFPSIFPGFQLLIDKIDFYPFFRTFINLSWFLTINRYDNIRLESIFFLFPSIIPDFQPIIIHCIIIFKAFFFI